MEELASHNYSPDPEQGPDHLCEIVALKADHVTGDRGVWQPVREHQTVMAVAMNDDGTVHGRMGVQVLARDTKGNRAVGHLMKGARNVMPNFVIIGPGPQPVYVLATGYVSLAPGQPAPRLSPIGISHPELDVIMPPVPRPPEPVHNTVKVVSSTRVAAQALLAVVVIIGGVAVLAQKIRSSLVQAPNVQGSKKADVHPAPPGTAAKTSPKTAPETHVAPPVVAANPQPFSPTEPMTRRDLAGAVEKLMKANLINITYQHGVTEADLTGRQVRIANGVMHFKDGDKNLSSIDMRGARDVWVGKGPNDPNGVATLRIEWEWTDKKEGGDYSTRVEVFWNGEATAWTTRKPKEDR